MVTMAKVSCQHLLWLSKKNHDLRNFIVVFKVFFHPSMIIVYYLLQGMWVCANPNWETNCPIPQENSFILSCKNKISIQM
jgi:hypothetical protein